jgi:hypothetical protein
MNGHCAAKADPDHLPGDQFTHRRVRMASASLAGAARQVDAASLNLPPCGPVTSKQVTTAAIRSGYVQLQRPGELGEQVDFGVEGLGS